MVVGAGTAASNRVASWTVAPDLDGVANNAVSAAGIAASVATHFEDKLFGENDTFVSTAASFYTVQMISCNLRFPSTVLFLN